MKDNELKDIWNNAPENININSSQILNEMNMASLKIERSIKKRNLRETIASIIVIIFFSIQIYRLDSWIEKIGSGIIVLAAAFIILKLMTTRNSQKRANLSASVKEQLLEDKKYLLKEQRLLKNVLYWYILPLCIPMLMISLANGITWFNGLVYIPIVVILAFYIYHINQKAAQKFEPIIQELEHSIKGMEENS